MRRLSDRYTIMSDGNFKGYFFDYFNCRDIKYYFLDTTLTDVKLIDVINHRRETGKDILLILNPITIMRLIREKSQWNDFISEVRRGKIKLIMSAGHPPPQGIGETSVMLSKMLCGKEYEKLGVSKQDIEGKWWSDPEDLAIIIDLKIDVLCETGYPGDYMRNSFPNWNFIHLSHAWLSHNEWNPISIFSNPNRTKTFFTTMNKKKNLNQHRLWLIEKIKDASYTADSILKVSTWEESRQGDDGGWSDLYRQYGKFWLDNIFLKPFVPSLELYDKTYFELVSESLGYHPEDDSFYMTEKTFKPIMIEHPFLMVSTRNHLKNMRRIGFKTFDGLIDESYDGLEHTKDRIMAIHQQLLKLDLKKSRDLYEGSREICRHNRNHLMYLQGRYKFDLWKNLNDYFQSIN